MFGNKISDFEANKYLLLRDVYGEISSLRRILEGLKYVSPSEFAEKMAEVDKRIAELSNGDSLKPIVDRIEAIKMPDLSALEARLGAIEGEMGGMRNDIEALKSIKVDFAPMESKIEQFQRNMTMDRDAIVEIIHSALKELIDVQDDVVRKKLAGSKGEDYKRALIQHQKLKELQEQENNRASELGWHQI